MDAAASRSTPRTAIAILRGTPRRTISKAVGIGMAVGVRTPRRTISKAVGIGMAVGVRTPRRTIWKAVGIGEAVGVRTPRRTIWKAVGIGMAVGVYAVSFGMLAVAAGLTPAQACVMSMLMFTGASQFAFVGVLAGGGGALAAMGPAVVLALRNAVYGVSVAPILPARLRDRALAAHLVIDETTAMARAEDDPAQARRAFLATGVSVWVCWNAGTLAGALLGGGIGDPRALGLDAMFPAAFLALLAPQLRRPGAPAAALAGAAIGVALVPFTPVGVPILAALAGVLVARGARA